MTWWHLEAPIERTWQALVAPEEWPSWWRYVEEVVELEKGNAQGIGAVRRYTWSSRLPYRLSLKMRTTAIARHTFIEGVATGDLNGIGRWELQELGNTTRVKYDWTVRTSKVWMNLLAPILAPVFTWNHDQVMREGGRGLARHLGVPLLAFQASSADRRG